MIAKALTFISGFLNKEIKAAYGIDEDCVLASNLVNQDGTVAGYTKDKIIISVINLKQDVTLNSLPSSRDTRVFLQ